MIGPLLAEGADALPIWTANDERRLIYSNTSKRIYLGTNVGWRDISGSGDVLLDADTVDGLHASSSPRANTLLSLDANMQLPASALMLDGHMASLSPSAGYIPVMNSEGKVNASITGDAATLNNRVATDFVRTNDDSVIDQHKLTIIGSQGQMNVSAGSSSALDIKPIHNETDPAMMAFSRPGIFSMYFGLDIDNKLKIGGMSLGGNKYSVWTGNNMGSLSGLDADTVDTFHASATPTPYYLLPLDENGQFPASTIPSGVGLPVGSLVMFPMGYPSITLPSDFISCRGQGLSTTSYPLLFAYLGYYYGGTSGTFYVPDYRGRFIRNVDCGAGRDPNSTARTAAAGGVQQGVGSIQSDVIRKHMHPCGGVIGTAGGGTGVVDHQNWNNTSYNYWTRDFDVSSDVQQGNLDTNGTTSLNRGTETRPINIYTEIGIKWR